MTDRELMQQALDLLNDINQCSLPPTGIPLPAEIDHVMEALRARLAQPEPEPVAWMYQHEDTGLTMCVIVQQVGAGFEKNNPRWKKITPLYTAQPQREWQGLTDEAVWNLYKNLWMFHPAEEPRLAGDILKFARAIEDKLKEKNT